MKSIQVFRRGLDLLAGRTDVDPERLGTIGHSLGGHSSLFLAAFDTRLKAAVTSCGFDTWQTYAGRHNNLEAWAQRRYMPRVAEKYGNDPSRMPFSFQEVLTAIAPRALFINAPMNDDNFDRPECANASNLFVRSMKPQAPLIDWLSSILMPCTIFRRPCGTKPTISCSASCPEPVSDVSPLFT